MTKAKSVASESSRAPASNGTKKVTISLRAADLDVMKRLAKRRHGGNLSGAFADLVRHATRLEAMDRVLEALPPPSSQGLARLEAELSLPLERPKPKRAKKRTAAAA